MDDSIQVDPRRSREPAREFVDVDRPRIARELDAVELV